MKTWEYRIKVLIMDVDGTLTDGKIYVGNSGEMMKAFHVRDGYAIHDMLPAMGILPVIVTGRSSEIVKIRCRELGIENIIQGSKDKAADIENLLNKYHIGWDEVAYMGDDLNDLEAMTLAGIRIGPSNVAKEINAICDYVCIREGGTGAVREAVEWIKEKYR